MFSLTSGELILSAPSLIQAQTQVIPVEPLGRLPKPTTLVWSFDPLPAGLVFVRARGATFRDGRACWNLGYLAPRSKRTLRIVARAERGFGVRHVRNVAVATAGNAARRTDGARVRVDPAFGGANGGVTG